jgi:hypothetical protein
MNPDIPEIDSCCEKEAYAFFGLASYLAQVLERSAINFALVLQLPEVNLVTRELYESINEALEKKTFGQLLKSCQKEYEIPETSKKVIFEALDLRNELTHRFFYKHSENFISEKGRVEMMKELQVIMGKFREADQALESIYLPIFDKYGVTEEYLTKEYESMMQSAINRDEFA